MAQRKGNERYDVRKRRITKQEVDEKTVKKIRRVRVSGWACNSTMSPSSSILRILTSSFRN